MAKGAIDPIEGVIVATRSHTLTGSVCSRAKQAICGRISPRPIIHSKAYRITTPFCDASTNICTHTHVSCEVRVRVRKWKCAARTHKHELCARTREDTTHTTQDTRRTRRTRRTAARTHSTRRDARDAREGDTDATDARADATQFTHANAEAHTPGKHGLHGLRHR